MKIRQHYLLLKWKIQDYLQDKIAFGWDYKKYITKDGITVEKYDDLTFYHINYQPHRLDGPAIERKDGSLEWWYHGQKIPCHSQERFESILKLKAFL